MRELDTATWYAFGIPAYVLYIGAEIALARRRAEKVFGFAETISNLTSGLGTLLVGLFVGPWVLRGWDFVHDHVAPFQWPAHGWWRLPAALLLSDFCYYIYHRAGHRFALFWSIHGIHHQHEHLNSSVGFRLEWLADPYAALFFGLMPLAGIDSTTGFLAIAILSFYALTAHTPLIGRRSWGIFITPAVHGAHHSRDARFAEKNFGAMFGFWDQLLGTWLEPARGETLRKDVPSISRTHDGVRTQFGLIVELLRVLAGERSIAAKARLLFSRPAVVTPKVVPRDDVDIARPIRIYVLVHFAALAAFSGWVLWFREERPLVIQIVSAVTIVLGLTTLGGLLDGRERALESERLRLIATAIVGAGIFTYSPGVAIALLAVAFGGFVGLAKVPSRAREPSA